MPPDPTRTALIAKLLACAGSAVTDAYTSQLLREAAALLAGEGLTPTMPEPRQGLHYFEAGAEVCDCGMSQTAYATTKAPPGWPGPLPERVRCVAAPPAEQEPTP